MRSEEQMRTVTYEETDDSEKNGLEQHNFTAEESIALLWFAGYQGSGRDCMQLMRHWEFLDWLVIMASLLEE